MTSIHRGDNPGVLNKFWGGLKNAVNSFLFWSFPESVHMEDSFEYWRIRILFTICFSGVIIGLLALFPSVFLALKEGRWDVAVIDLAFYIWLVFLFTARKLSASTRAMGAVGAIFFLGVALVLTLGPLGAGYVWIFAFAVFSGILLGMKAAITAWAMNVVAVMATAWLIHADLLPWTAELESPLAKWLVISASFLMLNLLTTLSTALVLRGLKTALEQGKRVGANLELERGKLYDSNKKLIEEIAVRTQAEKALRESEEMSRRLVEYSAVPTSVFSEDGRTQLINQAFSESFGWTMADCPSLDKWEERLFPDPEYRLEAVAEIRAMERHGNNLIGNKDKRVVCRDDGVKEAAFHSNVLPDGSCLIQMMDVTDRNQTERDRIKLEGQLRQSQKMEAIGALAGGIAHDFNNLLSVILGFAEFIKIDLEENDPIGDSVQEIEKAGAKGASLVRQLLAFSRKQIVHVRVLNLNDSIQDIEKMLVRFIGEDIELSLKLDPEIWNVEADPGQIDQVVMNLAANARDAMPTGGLLTIKTSNIILDEGYFHNHALEGRPGDYVMMSFSDTGTGMDEETISRIFEPFYTTKDRDKGTGLGLSTVYGIIKQANGFIWAYSEPGLGATFRLYLPRAEKDYVDELDEVKSSREYEGTETILVVEDDQMVRNLTTRVLIKKGYNVIEAENGEQALDIMTNHPDVIHLVLTDVIMPKTSGREVALGASKLRPDAKVIFMSGYIDDTVFRHGVIEHGANFIEKPFSPDQLVEIVRRVLDQGDD